MHSPQFVAEATETQTHTHTYTCQQWAGRLAPLIRVPHVEVELVLRVVVHGHVVLFQDEPGACQGEQTTNGMTYSVFVVHTARSAKACSCRTL